MEECRNRQRKECVSLSLNKTYVPEKCKKILGGSIRFKDRPAPRSQVRMEEGSN